MDSIKQPGFYSAQKVYRPSPRRYLKFENLIAAFLVVVISPFVVLGLLIVLITIFGKIPGLIGSLFGIGILVCFGAIEAFFVYYFLRRTHVRLVTSAEGIGYSTVGYRIFTPWDNIAGVGRREEYYSSRGRVWRTVEISGLELLQPAPVYKVDPLVRLFLRLSYEVPRPSFFIPVSRVVVNWLDSEVAADIQRYAPQVAMKLPLFRGARGCTKRLVEPGGGNISGKESVRQKR